MASSSSSKAASLRRPPALPPRQASSVSSLNQQPAYPDAPPPYEALNPQSSLEHETYESKDPRTSSTHSLLPTESNVQGGRRRLLMIYVHGFMGNETSFRSFPAHVHNLLTVLLMETHVVHTKIYPRYRSRRSITFARDNFSTWLEPHEADTTDVVLLGHSMGGLLGAEVVLMPAPPPSKRPLKHRILGVINFDVPFLGMHPGIVKSGLASLFNPAEEPGDKYSSGESFTSTNEGASSSGATSPTPTMRSDTLWTPERPDPNYNPAYPNDIKLPTRKGWQNALHFISKHSDHLFKDTKALISSHMEFGGAMANYGELKTRYTKVRALEEEQEAVRKSVVQDVEYAPPRVRFVNYYTASTGRPKPVKVPPTSNISADADNGSSLAPSEEVRTHDRTLATGETGMLQTSQSASPRITMSTPSDGDNIEAPAEFSDADQEEWAEAAESLTIGDSFNEGPVRTGIDASSSNVLSPTASFSTISTLPPIPDLPAKPPLLDVSYIEDRETRKLVEKEHARAIKSYESAVKDRDKAIAARSKLEKKRERKAGKEAEKVAKDAQKAKLKAEKDAQKLASKKVAKTESDMTQKEKEELRLANERERMEAEARRMRGEEPQPAKEEDEETPPASPISESDIISADLAPEVYEMSDEPSTPSERAPSPDRPSVVSEAPKVPPKDRVFCTLPPKDSAGQRDPCWIRIFMENMDEVSAHCGLFFVDERYERLVGDVASRVEAWVKADGDERATWDVD